MRCAGGTKPTQLVDMNHCADRVRSRLSGTHVRRRTRDCACVGAVVARRLRCRQRSMTARPLAVTTSRQALRGPRAVRGPDARTGSRLALAAAGPSVGRVSVCVEMEPVGAGVSAPPAPMTGLSEAEAAIYDRQIRLWGLDAQQRMRQAKVLLIGLDAVGAETAKNLVLSGVGSLDIVDSKPVEYADLSANFFLKETDIGQSRALAAVERVQELNPMVTVRANAVDVRSVDEASSLAGFTAVVLNDADCLTMERFGSACRRHSVPFLTTCLHGIHGFLVLDLLLHTYTPPAEPSAAGTAPAAPSAPRQLHYVPFEAVSRVAAADLPPRVSPAFRALLELWTRERALQAPLVGTLPELGALRAGFGPTAAVLGGVTAQEVLKVISGKDAPIDNVLAVNVNTGTGAVWRIPRRTS